MFVGLSLSILIILIEFHKSRPKQALLNLEMSLKGIFEKNN